MTNRPPLTIDETIDTLGVSDKTVRRMLKAGILEEQERDPKGRILISALSVDQAATRLAEQRDHDGHAEWLPAQAVAQTTALERAVETLTGMLERREDMIDELQRLIRQQDQELAELRAERKYLPSPDRIRELEDRIRELEAQRLDTRPMTDQAVEQGVNTIENRTGQALTSIQGRQLPSSDQVSKPTPAAPERPWWRKIFNR